MLPEALKSALIRAGHEKRFDDKQSIHIRGGGRAGLSIILAGRVRFGLFRKDGAYIQTGLLSVGDCFGEATLFADQDRAYDADALGDTTILSIEKGRFEKLMMKHPQLAHALLKTLTRRLYTALDFVDDLRALSVEARIAKQIMRLSLSGGFHDVIPVRQIDLAYSLGLSRVTVGKALDALECDGAVRLGYGQIEIVDHARLSGWR